MTNYYNGKTILITGAYGGFGHHFTGELLKAGASLILSDVVSKEVTTLFSGDEATTLPAEWPLRILASISTDLSTTEGCHTLYRKCQKLGIPIDMIIHNAGLGYAGALLDIPEELCVKNINVNLIAVMLLNKLFLPDMVSQKSGHLLYVSSVAGLVATSYAVPYTASKFGVRALAMSVHDEIKQYGIKTSIAYPFWAKTPIMKSQVFGNSPVEVMPDYFLSEPIDVVKRALAGAAKGKLHIPTDFFARVMWYGVRLWPIIAKQRSVRPDILAKL